MSNRVDVKPDIGDEGSPEPARQTRRSLLGGIAKAIFVAPAAVALVGIQPSPGTAQDIGEIIDRPPTEDDEPRRRRKKPRRKKRRRRRKRDRREERDVDTSCQPRIGQVFCSTRDR